MPPRPDPIRAAGAGLSAGVRCSASRSAARFAGDAAAWRDPEQVVGLWDQARPLPPTRLKWTATGNWWDLLDEMGVTLIVTREYEHLAVSLRCERGRPQIAYARIPHPSGIAVDRRRHTVSIASTRNPNQIVEWGPAADQAGAGGGVGGPLLPRRSWFFPGRLYLHDLVVLNGSLMAAAAGMNTVVRISPDGRCRPVWWPACVDGDGGPHFERNYLQLNSIATGNSLRTSFFSASSDRMSRRRPGHRNFAVDGKGVVFDGRTREVCCRGLTRPHAARLHRGQLWVLNSGYGQVGRVSGGRFEPAATLTGWTRGLAFCGPIAFVGVSRVLPRFRQYAPGLSLERSRCGLCAVCTTTGRVLAALSWPDGNQIFGIECMPREWTTGFPWSADGRGKLARMKELFYGYN
jgi:uncharacterized protein (TIGR03032 family)